MKIEKGMTLEQFVNVLNEKGLDANRFVFQYNNRLKEPLTKEMFVNPYEKPNIDDYQGIIPCTSIKDYERHLNKWQEAEKKVIFKDVRIEKAESLGLCKIFAGNYKVAHDWGSEIIFLDKTLGDLFRATNGELETKNFEI